MVVGKLVFISFSVSFSVFMCLSVSLVCLSLSSNVDFLVTQISFVIKYIKGRFSSRPQKFLRKEERRWKIMYHLLLNRSYNWLNIHNLDKYRTKLKKKTLACGNENSKSVTTKENYNQNYHDSLLPPIIFHTPQIFWKNKANKSNHNWLWKIITASYR